MSGKDLLNQSFHNSGNKIMPYQSKVLLTCKEKEENETLQQEEGNVVMEGILEMDNITTLEHSNKPNYTEWVKDVTNR